MRTHSFAAFDEHFLLRGCECSPRLTPGVWSFDFYGSPWLAHPTPLWANGAFPGRTSRLSPLPVEAIVRLGQAPATRIASMSRARATASLRAHAPFLESMPDAADEAAERLGRDVPAATLDFSLDEDFWPELEDWVESNRTLADVSGSGQAGHEKDPE